MDTEHDFTWNYKVFSKKSFNLVIRKLMMYFQLAKAKFETVCNLYLLVLTYKLQCRSLKISVNIELKVGSPSTFCAVVQ